MYCSLLCSIRRDKYLHCMDGWIDECRDDRYWVRVFDHHSRVSPCGDVGGEWGWSNTWCLILPFLFKVKRWHHRCGRGCVLEEESLRTHTYQKGPILIQAFPALSLEVRESFFHISLSINSCGADFYTVSRHTRDVHVQLKNISKPKQQASARCVM